MPTLEEMFEEAHRKTRQLAIDSLFLKDLVVRPWVDPPAVQTLDNDDESHWTNWTTKEENKNDSR